MTDTFPAHLLVELYCGSHNRFGLIDEQTMSPSNFNILAESYGVFNGCFELAEDIMSRCTLKRIELMDAFSFRPNGNPLTDMVSVSISEENYCLYHPDACSIGKNGKYRNLAITISMRAIEKHQVARIMHELIHAYEDLRRINNKAESLNNIVLKTGYAKNPFQNISKYNELKKRVGYLLYYLSRVESNAYIGQLNGEIMSYGITFNSAREAIEYLKSTNIYKNYSILFKLGNNLQTVKDKNIQKYILTYANQLSNRNFKSYNQFIKWIRKRITACKDKLERNVGKIASNIRIQETLNPSIDIRLDESLAEI